MITFNGQKGNKKGVVQNYTVNLGASETLAPINVPGVPPLFSGDWYKNVIVPATNQGAFTFAPALALQFSVSCCIAQSSGADFYIHGRVVIYIPATGQVMVFGVDYIADNDLYTGVFYAPTVKNGIVPIFLPEGVGIEVWLEKDYAQGGGYIQPSEATSVVLSLFNYEVAPVGEF